MTNQDGFFSRIIRDALSSLPNATGEHQALALEQEMQKVVEHSTVAPSKPNTQTSVQPAAAHLSIADEIASQPAASASHVKAQPSSINHQHSVALDEITTAQTANKIAANFPRDQRSFSQHRTQHQVQQEAQQKLQRSSQVPSQQSSQEYSQQKSQQESQPKAQRAVGKKIPLAISMRAAPHNQPLAPTAMPVESAAKVDSAAGNVKSGTLAANNTATSGAANTLAPATPASLRQKAAPVVAESAPVLAEHRPVERKTAAPTLRIGAVTIRVVEPVSPAAVVSRVNRPASHSHPAAVDPIASAESRHFLRTL